MITAVIVIASPSMEAAISLLDFANERIQESGRIGVIKEFGCPEGIIMMDALDGRYMLVMKPVVDTEDHEDGAEEDRRAGSIGSGNS